MTSATSRLHLARGFDIDPFASFTLPNEHYIDNQLFEQEMEAVFARTWQYVCHISALPNAGDYRVRDLGRRSALVVRDKDGTLLAFHNVCQHRAHRLVEGNGHVPGLLTCPYHAWAYNTRGQLISARKSEHLKDFSTDQVQLKPVRLEVFCGFIFINFDWNAQPMQALLPGLETSIRTFSPAPEKLFHAYSKEYGVQSNWKVSVENYSECYHCPMCHPTLSTATLDLKSYHLAIHEHYHAHISSDSGVNQGYTMKQDSTRSREFGAWYLWPNFCLEVYPGGYMNVLHHLPVSVDKTLQVVEWFCTAATPSREEQEVIDFVAVIREEDIPLCASVQRGLNSDGYQQGRFIVDPARGANSEHAVHDIQKKILAALGLLHTGHETSVCER
jgi:choline monooxygenase